MASEYDLITSMDRLTEAMSKRAQAVLKKRGKSLGKPGLFTRMLSKNAGNGLVGQIGRRLHTAGRIKTAMGAKGSGAALQGAGKAAMGIGAAVNVTVGAFKSLVDTTNELIAANKQYAVASASMALTMGLRDAKELMRAQNKGEAIAPSARRLVDAEQGRKDATKPIEILLEKIANDVMAFANDVAKYLIEPVGRIAAILDLWLFGKEAPEEKKMASQVAAMAEKQFENAVNRNADWFKRGKQ
jgi:hypothetical protein